MSAQEILAIDTSARGRAVLVITDAAGTVLDGEVHGTGAHSGGQAGTLLGAALPALLAGHRPAAVVVVTGPGSFTGVRAGIAAALGVAQAGSLPLHGTSALEVVALSTARTEGTLLAVSAAGRGSVYAARYLLRAGRPPQVLLPARRIEQGWAPPEDIPAVSSDGVPGTEPGDATLGLARAAALAVLGTPLPLAALAATYLDATAPI